MNIFVLVLNACDLGGIERSSFTLIDAFKNAGYKAEIISLYENPEVYIDTNEKYQLLTGKNEIHKLWNLLNSIPHGSILISAYDRISFYLSFLRKFHKKNIFLIAHQHADYFAHRTRVRVLRKYSFRIGCDAIVCLTHEDQVFYQKWFKKVYTVPNILNMNFVDNNTPITPISERPIDFIAAGRLHKIKRFSHFIKLHDALNEDNKVVSKLFGHGDQHDYLYNLSLSSPDILQGSTKSIFENFKSSKFLIVTSERESFSMVIIEAMAAGCVVVSYNCPTGPNEIIETNVNGVLIENGNLNELIKICRTLLNDSTRCQRLSENAILSSKKYYPKAVLNLWEHIFKAR